MWVAGASIMDVVNASGPRVSEMPLPTPQVPASYATFMAFDYGEKRVGVAVGNRMMRSAQPTTTIQSQGDARFVTIAKRIDEWKPDALVVGVPYHPDGAEHENTLRARKFGRQLYGRFGLKVYEVDERYSTTEALSSNARDADAASACIILEQFFRSWE